MSKASTERVMRDCKHTPPQHRHGTRQAYVTDRCRCPDCTTANARAEAQRRRARCYGQTPLVDADPIRAHLRMLSSAGIGLRQVAYQADVAHSTLSRLMWGEPSPKIPLPQRLRSGTASRVLAMSPASTSRARGALVDATGTHRRLQALVAIGWDEVDLARRLARSSASLRRTMARARVTVATTTEVRDLYERLCVTVPDRSTPTAAAKAAAARERARQQGWHPPLAWDDIDTDDRPADCRNSESHTARSSSDVDELDVEIAIDRVTSGKPVRLSAAELNEVIRRLTDQGHSLPQIAGYLDICQRTVSRKRRAARAA